MSAKLRIRLLVVRDQLHEQEVWHMALEGWGACKAVCQTRKTAFKATLNGVVAKLNEAR